MGTILFKIASVLGLACLLPIIFITGMVPLIEGKHLLDPYIDTNFAQNYSPEKFDEIEVRMTLEEVKRIVGEPLYIDGGYKDTTNANYQYTTDARLLGIARKNNQVGYYDFAWYRSSVEFDKENVVAFIDKGWSHD